MHHLNIAEAYLHNLKTMYTSFAIFRTYIFTCNMQSALSATNTCTDKGVQRRLRQNMEIRLNNYWSKHKRKYFIQLLSILKKVKHEYMLTKNISCIVMQDKRQSHKCHTRFFLNLLVTKSHKSKRKKNHLTVLNVLLRNAFSQ